MQPTSRRKHLISKGRWQVSMSRSHIQEPYLNSNRHSKAALVSNRMRQWMPRSRRTQKMVGEEMGAAKVNPTQTLLRIIFICSTATIVGMT